jgi:predicted nucleic acid-binding protein
VSKKFIDTTILIYAFDQHASAKRIRCRQILTELSAAHDAVVSTQVLQEFYVVATGKLRMPAPTAQGIVRSLGNLETVIIDQHLMHEAIEICTQKQFSFWDSLIIAAAESALCDTLYSEDLASGTSIRNVRIVNPLL